MQGQLEVICEGEGRPCAVLIIVPQVPCFKNTRSHSPMYNPDTLLLLWTHAVFISI
jgi:hypothetical protein